MTVSLAAHGAFFKISMSGSHPRYPGSVDLSWGLRVMGFEGSPDDAIRSQM